MSRSDVASPAKNEASPVVLDAEPGPIIRSIAKAERSFRWMSGFRNEPRFELAPGFAPNDANSPDRAA